MEYKNINKVIVLGIGGKASYYVVKFLDLLGIEIEGYDLKESKITKELEGLGIKINYKNPEEGERLNCDFCLYSNDIPQSIQKRIKNDNEGIEFLEIGKFYRQIIRDLKEENMSKEEMLAFKESNIAPLFEIDTNKMRYIAVTGTDGKTTTCTMIYHILKELGFKPALITTVAAYIGEKEIDTGLHTTTPSSQEMYELLKQIEKEDCTHIIIEATSHGLEQGRLAGLKFDSVGFTNITSEHLDYHGDWESYCAAKSLLITEHLKDNGNVVLNMDDKSYEVLSKLHPSPITYSIENVNENDFGVENIKEGEDKITFTLIRDKYRYAGEIPLLGKYNVSNFLCALAICEKEGLEIKNILNSIKNFETVKGRMEVLQKDPYYIIVDYAHTSNATKVALESARTLVKEGGKLIHVFGCAGQRDFYKRFEMGKYSNELSDVSILTAEDPRLEDLKDINDEIERGWKDGKNRNNELYRFDYMDKNVEVRRDAIKKGLSIAKHGDVVIIAGKAHEQSLCFGQVEYDWNDMDEVRKLLK
jgi:UDP-N-acetylmuramoyl-L-alanyl-D-glutamate--2,6-diaminopimelate ligase